MCISSKLPGDVDAAVPNAALGEARPLVSKCTCEFPGAGSVDGVDSARPPSCSLGEGDRFPERCPPLAVYRAPCGRAGVSPGSWPDTIPGM